MLSEENKSKLVMSGLYKCEPQLKWLPVYRRTDPYHCMNWTFYPCEKTDGTIVMVDTYFGTTAYELTDENFDKFLFLFDRNEVVESSSDAVKRYEPKDWFAVRVDSSGKRRYFLRKDAVASNALIIAEAVYEYEKAVKELEWAKSEMERKRERLSKMLENKHWKSQVYYDPEDVLFETTGEGIEAVDKAREEKIGFCWYNAEIHLEPMEAE